MEGPTMSPKISSFCNRGDCVQVEVVPGGWVRVTDTRQRAGVDFTTAEWEAFLLGVKAGEFDLDRP